MAAAKASHKDDTAVQSAALHLSAAWKADERRQDDEAGKPGGGAFSDACVSAAAAAATTVDERALLLRLLQNLGTGAGKQG